MVYICSDICQLVSQIARTYLNPKWSFQQITKIVGAHSPCRLQSGPPSEAAGHTVRAYIVLAQSSLKLQKAGLLACLNPSGFADARVSRCPLLGPEAHGFSPNVSALLVDGQPKNSTEHLARCF